MGSRRSTRTGSTKTCSNSFAARTCRAARDRTVVTSLFSTFPRGWPGFGLLLLRSVVGLTVVAHGWRAFHATIPSLSTSGTAAVAIGAGIALTVGLCTPVIAGLLSLGAVGVMCGWIPWSDAHQFGSG